MQIYSQKKISLRPMAYHLAVAILLLTASISLPASEVSQQYRDLTLNANLEMAEGKDYKDGIVLILHGFLGHNRMELVESTQQALLDNDHSSLAINLSLGIDNRQGFFECTWPHRHQQEDAIDEIAAWVDWLRVRGVSQITLLGHSRGANQTMVYTVDRRDPEVTRLILLAPGTSDDTKKTFEERYGKRFDLQLDQANKLLAAGKGDELIENTDFMFCPQASVSANTFNSYYGDNSKFRNFHSYLPRIKVPTLVTTGTQDERFPNIEKEVAPYIDGKLMQLSVIEGAGHFFRDFNIEEAMEAAIEFIDDTR